MDYQQTTTDEVDRACQEALEREFPRPVKTLKRFAAAGRLVEAPGRKEVQDHD